GADLLARPAGGLVERGVNPVVLAAGVQDCEELGERAMPAMAATVGSSCCHGLPHLCVLAANARHGGAWTGFGDDCVGPRLIRTDMRFPLAGGVGPGLSRLSRSRAFPKIPPSTRRRCAAASP